MTSPNTTASADAEQTASDFLAECSATRRHAVTVLVRHPRRAFNALTAIHRLPRLEIAPRHDVEGQGIRSGLDMPLGSRFLLGGVRAALPVPAHVEEYTAGSSRSKHTLRRKIRHAEKAGVTWRVIEDPAERGALAAIAAAHERSHPIARYRNPEPLVDGLEHFSFWAAAFDADGAPLLLTVIPHDGAWAVLRYFRQLRDNQVASDTRYLMTKVLVDRLGAVGVRYLIDEASPQWLSGGLRHFQRMVGFRLHRTRVR